MNYCVYKLTFPQGAHFGNGTLDETSFTFPADKLFSALYIEALKAGCEGTLLESAEKGRLLLSDALPFVGSQYLVPKPILYVERAKKSDVEDRKKYKKRKYLTLAELDAYMDGTLNLSDDPMAQFGMESSQTKIHLIPGEDAMPYYVGAYHYRRGNGLYLILVYRLSES